MGGGCRGWGCVGSSRWSDGRLYVLVYLDINHLLCRLVIKEEHFRSLLTVPKTANTSPALKDCSSRNNGRLWAITSCSKHHFCESCFTEVVMQSCEAIEIISLDTDAFIQYVFPIYNLIWLLCKTGKRSRNVYSVSNAKEKSLQFWNVIPWNQNRTSEKHAQIEQPLVKGVTEAKTLPGTSVTYGSDLHIQFGLTYVHQTPY